MEWVGERRLAFGLIMFACEGDSITMLASGGLVGRYDHLRLGQRTQRTQSPHDDDLSERRREGKLVIRLIALL